MPVPFDFIINKLCCIYSFFLSLDSLCFVFPVFIPFFSFTLMSLSSLPLPQHRIFNTLHQGLVSRPFVLRFFALPPLSCLHHFLICAHVRFNALWVVHLQLLERFLSYGSIIFDLRPVFQERNYDVKQGLMRFIFFFF
jgi:hypothetical protein